MECRIVKEQDDGIMFHNGYLNLYVKKDCDSMNGNKHKATAHKLPKGKNQKDWENQPSFKQSDLYVIPEGLVYDIFSIITMYNMVRMEAPTELHS